MGRLSPPAYAIRFQLASSVAPVPFAVDIQKNRPAEVLRSGATICGTQLRSRRESELLAAARCGPAQSDFQIRPCGVLEKRPGSVAMSTPLASRRGTARPRRDASGVDIATDPGRFSRTPQGRI